MISNPGYLLKYFLLQLFSLFWPKTYTLKPKLKTILTNMIVQKDCRNFQHCPDSPVCLKTAKVQDSSEFLLYLGCINLARTNAFKYDEDHAKKFATFFLGSQCFREHNLFLMHQLAMKANFYTPKTSTNFLFIAVGMLLFNFCGRGTRYNIITALDKKLRLLISTQWTLTRHKKSLKANFFFKSQI